MEVELKSIQRISKNLLIKIQKIIEQEKGKGHKKVSVETATEIISRRIDAAGGLKEDYRNN